MRSLSRLRSRLSVFLSLVALVSMIGGWALFVRADLSPRSALAKSLTYANLTALQKHFLSGLVSSEMHAPQSTAHTSAAPRGSSFASTTTDGCFKGQENAVRINQNCLNISDTDLQGRGQVQTDSVIAEDPLHPGHMVAGSNDYRNGDSGCYSAFSRDSGHSWNETAIPIGFSRGDPFGGAREYWQVSGNTSVAWDTKGNAYLNCESFMRGLGTTNNADLSSAFYVFRSTGSGGASWDFPGHPVVEASTRTFGVIDDKPYMAIDDKVGSPFQDRIYVTWTAFAGDGSFYIYEAHSSDYGQSFSAPVVVSISSPLCANTFGVGTPQGPCNANEFSEPFTGPDGALYVVYNNFNTALTSATDNHFQVFLSKSVDGGVTFLPPVLVANYHDFPDCATYQGGQNEDQTCIPEKGATENSVFRATNYATGAVNPVNGSIVVTFGSYISKYSNPANGCVPQGIGGDELQSLYNGVKTAGACTNKILASVSTNGGASFNGDITDPTKLTVVSAAPAQRFSDQWFHWEGFTRDGRLVVSYYDRQYGNNETTGKFDLSLSTSRDIQHFTVNRITTSSLPLPTQFPSALGNGTFLGDFTGLVVDNHAHPIWTDTRNPDLALCPGTGTPTVPPRVCTFTSVPGGPAANAQVILTTSAEIPGSDT
jgi:hypothetical protein